MGDDQRQSSRPSAFVKSKGTRRYIWLLVSFLAGVVISFATAYLSVWYFVPREFAMEGRAMPPYVDFYFGVGPKDHRWTLDLENYSFGVFVGSLQAWDGYDSTQAFGRDRQGPESIPYWSRAKRALPEDVYDQEMGLITEVAAGFPLTSWKGELRRASSKDPGKRWFCFEVRPASGGGYPALVPAMPIIPGGLLNAIFGGGVFFVATVQPVRMYRFAVGHIRRSRGQCAKCGYDITGLNTCPECGVKVVGRTVHHAQ